MPTIFFYESAGMFRAYLAQSPLLDQGIGGPLAQHMSAALANDSQPDAFFFMNVGDEPNLAPMFGRMEEIFETSTSDSFSWFASHEAGKSHMTTRLVGQYDGLEQFFAEDWGLPRAIEEMTVGGTVALDAHLKQLAKSYGGPVLYPEESFQPTTQGFLSKRDLSSAKASARVYVRQYPKFPVAHFLLGVTLASSGDRGAGLEAIETAIRHFENDPNPEIRPVYENMKQMRKSLAGGP